MQTVKAIMNGSALETVLPLPGAFKDKKVEVVVRLLSETGEAEAPRSSVSLPEPESFGMWRDREDMADVEGYVRSLRERRRFS